MSAEKIDKLSSAVQWHISRQRKFLKTQEMRADLDENRKIFIGKEYDFIRSVEDMIEELRRFYDANMGKMPPQDLDLEREVLAAVISHPGAVEDVSDVLLPEHFATEAHCVTYRLVLKSEVNPPGLRNIVQLARKDGVLEAAGGVAYLAEIDSSVRSPVRVRHDALVVIEYAMRRKLLEGAQNIMVEAYDDTMDVFELLKASKKSIEEVEAWTKGKTKK